jgi:hypothetical protein
METPHTLTRTDQLYLALILLCTLAASLLYLWPSPAEFPMDDGYIHFVYAENLSTHGQLFFNEASEKGVGTSSILWVLLLAAGHKLGLSLHLVAKVLGIASLSTLGVALYSLLRPLYKPVICLVASLAVVLSGHMLWFALSGMETVLFLALAMLALLCYRDERWALLGIILGLLVLTRIEGGMLALAIGLFDLWRQRSLRRGLLAAAAICAVLCGPWIVYLYSRTGYVLPTSGIGKHFTSVLAIQVVQGQAAASAVLSRLTPLAYPIALIVYTLEFILGGAALPPPYITIIPGLGSLQYKLSVWAIAGWCALVFPLGWIALRKVVSNLKAPARLSQVARAPLFVFLGWLVLHNLSYMIYLPSIGTASRYAAVDHIALWVGLVLAVFAVRKPRLRLALGVGLACIAVANTVYWNTVYDANLDHMVNVRIPAANYIRENVPAGDTCAASDVGAMRYYGERRIVDLGGLINPELSQWFFTGDLDRYMVANHVTCLVLPGRPGVSADGVFDLAREMGFTETDLFSMHMLRVFEIDHQRWLQGYLPVMNYQATVTVYRLDAPP